MKRAGLLIATVAAFLPALAGLADDERPKDMPYATPGEIPSLAPDYRLNSHKVVLITDQALNPRLATLEKGQIVAWISYSASESVVVFEREVAKDMRCHALVNFSLKEDELRSAPINAGEFASFCELKPGRYRYKVVRPRPVERDDARRQLEGEIVVADTPDDAEKKKKE